MWYKNPGLWERAVVNERWGGMREEGEGGEVKEQVKAYVPILF